MLSNLSGYISTYISGGKLSDASDKPVIRDFVRSLMSAMRLHNTARVANGGFGIYRDFMSSTFVPTSPLSSRAGNRQAEFLYSQFLILSRGK